MLQAPLPTLGLLAAKVAEPVEQIVCVLPAFDAVGGAFTTMLTLLALAAQGAWLIVQVRT